jgi:hypothetical protein
MVLVNRPPPLLVDEHSVRKHLVVLRLRDIRDRLLQHHAGSVDDDVDLLVLGQDVGEQFLNSSSGAEVAGVDGDVDARMGL